MDAAEQDELVEPGPESMDLVPSGEPLTSIEPADASPSDETIREVEAETTPPAAQSTSPMTPLAWAGGGIIVGAIAMLLFTRFVPYRPSSPKFAAVPPVTQKHTLQTQAGPATSAATSSTAVTSAGTGEEKTSAGVPPVDPFGASHSLAIPPPAPLKGNFSGPILPSAAISRNRNQGPASTVGTKGGNQGSVSTPPGKSHQGEQKQSPPETKNTVQLLTMSASVGDPDGARRQLSAWARKVGGSSQSFRTYDDKYESPVDGVIIFVPEAKLQEFMKFAESIGSTSLDETWVGSSAERRSRLTGQAESQLDALRKKKDELRKQYEDDATQIKHATEGIDILSKSLGQLRPSKGTDGLEAVRVLLISKTAQAAAGISKDGD